MCLYIYICVLICVYIRMHTHIYIYMYTDIHTHTYIYIYICSFLIDGPLFRHNHMRTIVNCETIRGPQPVRRCCCPAASLCEHHSTQGLGRSTTSPGVRGREVCADWALLRRFLAFIVGADLWETPCSGYGLRSRFKVRGLALIGLRVPRLPILPEGYQMDLLVFER